MLAPLVVRVLGVLAKLPTSALEGEIIERNRGGGGEGRRVTSIITSYRSFPLLLILL